MDVARHPQRVRSKALVVSMAALSIATCGVLAVRERLRDSEGYVMPVKATHAAHGPNVIVVVLDTTRRDAVSPYGAVSDELTPSLSRLADHGVVFEAAYSAASFSGPSYASLLTGRYPSGHGVLNHPDVLPGSNRTMFEVAADAGYYTLHVTQHAFLRDNWNYHQGALLYRFSEDADALIDLVTWWIDNHPGVSYVAMISLMGAHYPYGLENHPGGLWDGLSERDRQLHLTTDASSRQFAFATTGLSEAYAAAQWQSYLSEVQRADRQVGRIVATVERSGRAEDTVIIVTSDHGEAFGEHGFYFCHDPVVYGPVSKVPLIVSWPGRLPVVRVRSVVSLVDLVPTVGELIDGDLPSDLDGGSWMPLLHEVEPRQTRPVFCYARPFDEQVRDRFPLIAELSQQAGYPGSPVLGAGGRWDVVVRALRHGFVTELFDRADDPLHGDDVWPEHATEPEVQRLVEEVHAYRMRLLAAAAATGRSLSDEQREGLRRLGYIE